MNAFQAHLRRRDDARVSTIAIVAFLCLALLVLLTAAQVVHTHPKPGDADHCLLCVTMHSVVPAVATVAVALSAGSWVPTLVHKTRPVSRYWCSQLFIRPPPACR